MPGLRERRHAETKQVLLDVAFELFIARGFSKVTMEEVAQAAGVSRSTAYRRFPTKDDVVLEVARGWLGAFDAAVDALSADTLVQDAVATATFAVARHIDEDRARVRAAYAILDTTPELEQSSVATTAWLDRFVDLLDRFSDIDDETARIVAGSYLGAIDAMMQHWALTGGTSSVTKASGRLLKRLAPILPIVERGER